MTKPDVITCPHCGSDFVPSSQPRKPVAYRAKYRLDAAGSAPGYALTDTDVMLLAESMHRETGAEVAIHILVPDASFWRNYP